VAVVVELTRCACVSNRNTVVVELTRCACVQVKAKHGGGGVGAL
jgi:hypothetical protein